MFNGYISFSVAKEMVLKPEFVYLSLCEGRVHVGRSRHHAASCLDWASASSRLRQQTQSSQKISASVSAHLLPCTCAWQRWDVSSASRHLFRLFWWLRSVTVSLEISISLKKNKTKHFFWDVWSYCKSLIEAEIWHKAILCFCCTKCWIHHVQHS